MHRIQRAFTFKMMYRNLGTSGGATNSLNRALIRYHHTDYSTEREQLAFCLGKYEKDSIVKDCVEVSSLFKIY